MMEKKPVASEGSVQTTVDSGKFITLSTQLKRLMGAPEYVDIRIDKHLELAAEYHSGNIVLTDREAVLKAPSKSLKFRINFDVITSALKGRGETRLKLHKNQLLVVAARYQADLNINKVGSSSTFDTLKGQDSEPLKMMLKEAKNYLNITNMVEENKKIDVHFSWDQKGTIAAAADPYHAVIVKGPTTSKTPHQVTMTVDLATKLAEIGGKFDLGDNRVRAQNENSRAEINQVNSSDSLVPMKRILGLLDAGSLWQAEFSSKELSSLLDNLGAVDDGQRIDFEISSKIIKVKSRGRQGTVTGEIEINTTGGKPPKKVTFSPKTLNSIVEKCSGNVRINLLCNEKKESLNSVMIQPVKQGDWQFFGFVSLTANTGSSSN